MYAEELSILNGGFLVLAVSIAFSVIALVKGIRCGFTYDPPTLLLKRAKLLSVGPFVLNVFVLVLFVAAALAVLSPDEGVGWLLLLLDIPLFALSAAVCPPLEVLGIVFLAVCIKKQMTVKRAKWLLVPAVLSLLTSCLFIYWVLWAILG